MANLSNINNPPAYMGFVGFAKVLGGTINGNNVGVAAVNHDSYTIRATTVDINLTQEISKPDVVDSRYDRTVYQLGPKLVDGSVAFPALYEIPAGQTVTLFEILYRYAATRADDGLLSTFDMEVKYAPSSTLPNEAEFKYQGCIVNTWQFAVAQSDVVTCSFDLIGVDRTPPQSLPMLPPARSANPDGSAACEGGTADTTYDSNSNFGTTRIVTWNDARVELSGGRLTSSIGGQFIRSFEANINNDAERFYTLNTQLFAQAIAPRKRDVTGNIVLMGRHTNLGSIALSNQEHCTEYSNVKFGYATSDTGDGCGNSSFNVILPNTIFEIEEMSLSNDIFETTVNWHSLPAAGSGVCDPLLATLNTATFDYEADYSG